MWRKTGDGGLSVGIGKSSSDSAGSTDGAPTGSLNAIGEDEEAQEGKDSFDPNSLNFAPKALPVGELLKKQRDSVAQNGRKTGAQRTTTASTGIAVTTTASTGTGSGGLSVGMGKSSSDKGSTDSAATGSLNAISEDEEAQEGQDSFDPNNLNFAPKALPVAELLKKKQRDTTNSVAQNSRTTGFQRPTTGQSPTGKALTPSKDGTGSTSSLAPPTGTDSEAKLTSMFAVVNAKNKFKEAAARRVSDGTNFMAAVVHAPTNAGGKSGEGEAAAALGGGKSGMLKLRKMNSELIKDQLTRLPLEFSEKQSIKQILCPKLISQLESGFATSESERLRRAKRTGLLNAVLLGVLMIFDCVREFLESGAKIEHINAVVFTLLLSCWCYLFAKKNSRHALKKQKEKIAWKLRLAGSSVVFYGFFWQFLKDPGTVAASYTQHIEMMILTLGWMQMSAPLPLDKMLVVVHAIPIAWVVRNILRGRDVHDGLLDHMVYLYGFNMMFFMIMRSRTTENRLTYLGSRMAKQINKQDQEERQALAEEVEKFADIDTEDFFGSLLAAHKERLNALKALLENPKAKGEIQSMHEAVVRSYLALAQSSNVEEAHVQKVQSDFVELRNYSERESLRLGKIMEQLWDNFAQLKEWNAIIRVPSFEFFDRVTPKEKLSQPSTCSWWRDKDGRNATVMAPLGLVSGDNKLGWYADRSLWARAAFVRILKEAVQKFNEAEVAADLDLFPEQVIKMWNRQHPEKRMTELPFDPESPLATENLEMSQAMSHEYMESGCNCALQIGPNKERTRVLAKIEEYQEESKADPGKYPDTECLEKYVCDWLRGRVMFANPAALAIFFWYLVYKEERFWVVVCKNKLIKKPEGDTSCNIHLNVRLHIQGEDYTAEIQLLLENFLIAKDLEHKYYEYRRAGRLVEILAPVLEVPDDMDLSHGELPGPKTEENQQKMAARNKESQRTVPDRKSIVSVKKKSVVATGGAAKATFAKLVGAVKSQRLFKDRNTQSQVAPDEEAPKPKRSTHKKAIGLSGWAKAKFRMPDLSSNEQPSGPGIQRPSSPSSPRSENGVVENGAPKKGQMKVPGANDEQDLPMQAHTSNLKVGELNILMESTCSNQSRVSHIERPRDQRQKGSGALSTSTDDSLSPNRVSQVRASTNKYQPRMSSESIDLDNEDPAQNHGPSIHAQDASASAPRDPHEASVPHEASKSAPTEPHDESAPHKPSVPTGTVDNNSPGAGPSLPESIHSEGPVEEIS